MSVQEKYHISTVHNQIERLKEEESLLLLEMTQYLMYFKNTVPEKLECDIQGSYYIGVYTTPPPPPPSTMLSLYRFHIHVHMQVLQLILQGV